MPIDRKLLRRAWPDGYLPMRGVSTVGGYILAPIKFDAGGSGWRAYNLQTGLWAGVTCSQLALRGDLLPNVDPDDIATWACLLRDLADAAGAKHSIHGNGFAWSHHKEAGAWNLFCNGEQGIAFFGIDTDDPAEALVLARIQVREKEVQRGR